MSPETKFEAKIEAGRVNLVKKVTQNKKKAIFYLYRGHGPISLATEAGHFSDLKIDPYSSVWDWIKIQNTKKLREYGTELHPTTSVTILTADLV